MPLFPPAQSSGEYKELTLVFIATSQANNHCGAGRVVGRLSANTGLRKKRKLSFGELKSSGPPPLPPQSVGPLRLLVQK